MQPTWRDRRDQLSRRWIYGLFILLPVLAVFGHRGVAPWLLLASLPAFARGDFWQGLFGRLFDHPSLKDPTFACLISLLAFCLWILLSGFWSPKHHYSLFLWILAPGLVGASVVWFSLNLSRQWAWRLGRAFSLAVAGGMIVLAFEGVTGGFLRDIVPPKDISPDGSRDMIALGRGVTALAPALFPAAAIAVRVWSRGAAVLVLFIGLAAALANDVAANAFAIGVGLGAAVICLAAQRPVLRTAGWGAILFLLVSPFVAMLLPVEATFELARENYSKEVLAAATSALHRIAIWQAVGLKTLAGLPFGYGADFSRIWSETAPMVIVPGAPSPLSVIPTHPHNIFLQTWLELGVPGVAALASFLFFGLKALLRARLSKAVSAAVAGAFIAILISINVEGSLWQVWRFAAMALAASGIALAHALEKR
ncbi:O-antigen ligase family protein [Hyphococcus flavus]|uniref:O-antigen ligase family protein n=1 Tax=Hyphococcus flavus TaxID=1866326 RepID=A0AAF0CC47_9PROT|nr:O-antigen ligase family protein [Hyphococcus flavus]WDI32575.1 O-antigen ligase family protein [Hyphococcus flavus]